MAKWIDIGPSSDFPPDAQACLQPEGMGVVVFNIDGDLHAIANICPHAALPLGEGERQGKVIVCPFHGYAYDVTTGRNVDDPAELPVMRYEVRKTDAGRVEVKLPIAED